MEFMEYPISPSYTKEKQKERVLDMDLSCKLHLITRSIDKIGNRKIAYSDLAVAIYKDSGTHISESECEAIIKKYPFLFKRFYIYEVLLASVSIIYAMSLIDGSSSLAYFFILLMVPFFLSFFIELHSYFSLITFNPRLLMPDVAVSENIFRSTAILIASRNEPFLVARMTFDSALALTYPNEKKEIIVVDNSDSTFPDFQEWKRYVESYSDGGSRKIDGLRVIFVHRDGVEGFKPRNLDIGLCHVSSEFIFYLDVDSSVKKDTLLRIMPFFDRDQNLGFIQLQSIPSNAKGASPLALVHGLSSYFLRLTTALNSHASHSLFYGHNAVWRTKVVREIGCCLEYHNDETIVTEDLSMSLRARFIGYHGMTAWLESGEWVPESMRETESMWLRWTVGTYQVYAKHLLNLGNIRKFNFREIIGWLHHVISLTNSAFVPLYVGFGLLLKSDILMWLAFLSSFPQIALSICVLVNLPLDKLKTTKKLRLCYASFFIFSSFINWIKLKGFVRYILGKRQGWIPTSKTTGNEIAFLNVFINHRYFIAYGLLCITLSLSSLSCETSNCPDLFQFFVGFFYGINCLLSVCLFGNSVMKETPFEAASKGHVENYDGFYLK